MKQPLSQHLLAFDIQAERITKACAESWDTRISELSNSVIARLQLALETRVLDTIRSQSPSDKRHSYQGDWFSEVERDQYGNTIRYMYRNVDTTQTFMTYILNHFNQNGFTVMWATTDPTKLTISWTVDSVKHIFVNL